jgi:diguanylate cyclase (GGDEF)-like protein
MHKPERYGDDLSDIRYSVKMVNKNLKYIEGFEEGRIYNGFRYVYPVVVDGVHLGSIETSISSKEMIKDIEKILKNRVDIFVNANIIKDKVWDKSYYHISTLNSNYMHETHGKHEHEKTDTYYAYKKLNPYVKDSIAKAEKFAVYKYNMLFMFLPISNVKGQKASAYLVATIDSPVINNMKTDNTLLKLIAFASSVWISILVYFFIKSFNRVKVLAHYDELTNMLNRRSFKSHLTQHINSKNIDQEISIIFFDIDHFKEINDTYGHNEGDRVLKEIAHLVKANLRKDDLVSRWGGEEFLVLLSEVSTKDTLKIANKIRAIIRDYDFELSCRVTCSFGVTKYKHGEGIEDFIARADKLMYEAKESGRDRVVNDISNPKPKM